jgi:hypothetical protein
MYRAYHGGTAETGDVQKVYPLDSRDDPLCFMVIVGGILLYFPCYLVSKDDPELLSIALDNLFQIDYMEE